MTNLPPFKPAFVYRVGLMRRSSLWLCLLVLGVLGMACLSLAIGSVNIPLSQVLTILLGGESHPAAWATIVWQFRLPKTITAILAGAALATSGLQMQTLFRNPLAGPFVLGISAGASLGVALVVLAAQLTGISRLLQGAGLLDDLGLVMAANLGSAIALLLVLVVAHRVHNSMTLLILGLMVGYVANAVVTILIHFSPAEQIQAYLTWTFGSFSGLTWQQIGLLIPIVVVGLAIAQFSFKPLNLMLLDEMRSVSLGLNLRQAQFWIILSASLLAGSITAFCGPISFLGVAVPHICRSLLKTLDHRILIPATTLMGAILALLADLVAQLPGQQTILPLNAVTALIGAPIVTWVILKRQQQSGF